MNVCSYWLYLDVEIFNADLKELIYILRSRARYYKRHNIPIQSFSLQDEASGECINGELDLGFVWFFKNNTLHHI